MPVFADIDAGSLNLDPGAVAGAVTGGRRRSSRCTSPGAPCDMDAIEAIARDHGIVIVEDAAHAVETTVGDRKVGSIGDFTCFSLYATKSLAGGEGGMRRPGPTRPRRRPCGCSAHRGSPAIRGSGMQNRSLGHYDVVRPGYKANLADLQAAMALPKLDRIGELHARRATLVERYDAGSPGWPASSRSPGRRFGVHAHHLYIVRIDPAVAGGDRDRYAEALMAENISTGLHFLPVHTADVVPGEPAPRLCPRPSAPAPRCCRSRCRRRTTRATWTTCWQRSRSSTPRSPDEPADTRRAGGPASR